MIAKVAAASRLSRFIRLVETVGGTSAVAADPANNDFSRWHGSGGGILTERGCRLVSLVMFGGDAVVEFYVLFGFVEA